MNLSDACLHGVWWSSGDHLLTVYEHIIICYTCSYILDISFVPAKVTSSTQEMLSVSEQSNPIS